jgi:O-antigen/teichoic acid export membrane protein
MRRDIASAYFATGIKIASWVVVSAVVFRIPGVGPEAFAVLALIRGTIGLLNYTSLGLGPAMVRTLAESGAAGEPTTNIQTDSTGRLIVSPVAPGERMRAMFLNGIALSAALTVVGLLLVGLYALLFHHIHRIPAAVRSEALPLAIGLAIGTVLRLASDGAGAVLQVRGRIATDNLLLAEAEIFWAALCVLAIRHSGHSALHAVGTTYALAGFGLLAARYLAADAAVGKGILRAPRQALDAAIMRRLLGLGLLITIAQLADFLYAPTDYILINLLIDPTAVATYAPAVQIDAGLLLLVAGLANILLPKAAVAHTSGDLATVRRYYVRGTLASALLLTFAAALVWAISPILFKLWLGNSMRPTQIILPLVLIHTVVGGSSGVGRAILLGMGKVTPFTISVLAAGVANVILSYIFVRYLHLGLPGIIYGTIFAVVGRCGVWMPWYILYRAARIPRTA